MKKILILILAYNAERHIVSVLQRLPAALWENTSYTTDVVVIDDCSADNTSRVASANFASFKYPIRLLRNPVNQGYGGNQKIGYAYAIENNYDAAVMLHGDGQYPPEMIPDLVAPIVAGEADAVFGSRLLNRKDALKGGMPLYKFLGNIVLTKMQNKMLGSNLSEFHTGFRAYSIEALKRIPFQYNSEVFHFDTDIIIQCVDNNFRIKEIAIPTHYGDEICHVNGMRYAKDVMYSTFLSRIQKYGIFYAPKFDYAPETPYHDKTSFISSHSFALAQVGKGERILYFDDGGAHVAAHLIAKGCNVTYCGWKSDNKTALQGKKFYDKKISFDLNNPDFSELNPKDYDVVFLMDVVIRMQSPEKFLEALHVWCATNKLLVVVTAPNTAFFIQRLMLFIGQFNYGKSGTLDKSHLRLFTWRSLKQLLINSGFGISTMKGIPAPFPLAFGNTRVSRLLLKINGWLIKCRGTLFSYQIVVVARPRPTLEWLVQHAMMHGDAVSK